MKSAIQTLTDGLVFCENYLRDNPNCSGQNKRLKQQQIIEHKKALKILTTNLDASKNTLPIQNVSNCKTIRYSEGDNVIVKDCLHGHKFEIGEEITIVSVLEEDYLAKSDTVDWYIQDSEIKSVE